MILIKEISMKNKKIIFFLFLFLVNPYNLHLISCDEDTVFFNMLYIGMKRSEATIDYLINFVEFENLLSSLHKQILSKMRNPSKLGNGDFFDEYNKKQIEYLNGVKDTLHWYNLYKNIYNNTTDMLSKEKKDILKKQKETIANNLLKQLFDLKNVILTIRDFFKNIENLDNENQYRFFDIKNMVSNVSDKISLYLYYQKMYVAFDNVLIRQYDYFMKLKHMFNSYYKQFWVTIEKERLSEIIKTYNIYMNLYQKNNNSKIKEIEYNNDMSEIIFTKNDLPSVLYNKFL